MNEATIAPEQHTLDQLETRKSQLSARYAAECMGRLTLIAGNVYVAISGHIPESGITDNSWVRAYGIVAVGIQAFNFGIRHSEHAS